MVHDNILPGFFIKYSASLRIHNSHVLISMISLMGPHVEACEPNFVVFVVYGQQYPMWDMLYHFIGLEVFWSTRGSMWTYLCSFCIIGTTIFNVRYAYHFIGFEVFWCMVVEIILEDWPRGQLVLYSWKIILGWTNAGWSPRDDERIKMIWFNFVEDNVHINFCSKLL